MTSNAKERLESFGEKRIEDVVVGIFGIGAVGNQLLYRLVSAGVRKFVIIDRGVVRASDIDGSALFRIGDTGRAKVDVAAERVRELSVSDEMQIEALCADVRYEVGSGVFRRLDLVLACLDNDGARLYVDRQCSRFGKPLISAEVSDFCKRLSLAYHERTGICLHCGKSYEDIAQAMRVREFIDEDYEEDETDRELLSASETVALLQANKALDYIRGESVDWGTHYTLIGGTFFDTAMQDDEYCVHSHYCTGAEVVELEDVSVRSMVRELLSAVKRNFNVKSTLFIDMSDERGREYVIDTYCMYCSRSRIPIGVPKYRFRDDMAICESCRIKPRWKIARSPLARNVYYYSEEETAADILDTMLENIGIPPLHILRVCDEDENEYYVELTGDLLSYMPCVKKNAREEG